MTKPMIPHLGLKMMYVSVLINSAVTDKYTDRHTDTHKLSTVTLLRMRAEG